MSRKRRRPSLPKSEQFVQLINHFRAEPAWRALGCSARIAYIEIKSLYNGQNNGNLMASVRWLAEQTGISRGTAEKALRDLQEYGFIVAMRGGHLGAEGQGQGTLWRLTELGYAGDRPTKDYQNWQPQNRSPSYKKGQGVPRNETVLTEGVLFDGTGCPIKRDSLSLKSRGPVP